MLHVEQHVFIGIIVSFLYYLQHTYVLVCFYHFVQGTTGPEGRKGQKGDAVSAYCYGTLYTITFCLQLISINSALFETVRLLLRIETFPT